MPRRYVCVKIIEAARLLDGNAFHAKLEKLIAKRKRAKLWKVARIKVSLQILSLRKKYLAKCGDFT